MKARSFIGSAIQSHVRVPPQFIPTIGDALFPGVPNPPALLRAQPQQPAESQRHLVVRSR